MSYKIVLFSLVFCLSIIAAKAQPPKLCNIKGVLVERNEAKISSQTSQSIIEKLRYDPNYFKPMSGIMIEAKRDDNGTVVSIKTDKDGSYAFKNLADGIYVVSPASPKDYEKGVYYATVVSKDCIESNDIFEIHTIGNVKGRIENLPLYGGSVSVNLYPADSEKIYYKFKSLIVPRKCEITKKLESAIEFDCSGFPTGKYYLSIDWRDSGRDSIYYPGVGNEESIHGKKPEIIEIKKGQTTDASFKLPYRN